MAKRRQQRYTDEQRATALALLVAVNMNYAKTAKETGIPNSTLRKWQNDDVRGQSQELTNSKKSDLSIDLKELALKIVGILGGKVDGATTRELFGGLGIVVDRIVALDPALGDHENPTTQINIQAQAITSHTDLDEIAPRPIQHSDNGKTG